MRHDVVVRNSSDFLRDWPELFRDLTLNSTQKHLLYHTLDTQIDEDWRHLKQNFTQEWWSSSRARVRWRLVFTRRSSQQLQMLKSQLTRPLAALGEPRSAALNRSLTPAAQDRSRASPLQLLMLTWLETGVINRSDESLHLFVASVSTHQIGVNN